MPPPAPRASWPRRLLRPIGMLLAAVWIVLEEWIWDGLTAAMAWVGRLPVVRWVEARIAALPPYAAMAMFLVPMVSLFPAKLLGLWLIGTGRVTTGLVVFAAAKVLGTALAARLFALTKPRLLTVRWFRRVYEWFTAWRDRLHAWLRSLRVWQRTKAWLRRVRTSLRSWYRTRFVR